MTTVTFDGTGDLVAAPERSEWEFDDQFTKEVEARKMPDRKFEFKPIEVLPRS